MVTETEAKPVRQAFGSPGGKTYLAPRIVDMIPEHETYIEPFAGGAAVYFKKPPSEKEVLSDKDKEIAFAFRFLRDMTPEQFERLKRYDWIRSRELFDKLKANVPKDDVERFRKFYYLKKASYASGGETINPVVIGKPIGIDKLPQIQGRLKYTSIHGGDAIAMVRKYDSPSSFFFLDPPYPGRDFVGAGGHYTTEDLQRLIGVLKGTKGKFTLTLGTEHENLLPSSWHIKRVKVFRNLFGGDTKTYQYEIIATNYNPDTMRHALRVPLVQPPRIIRRASNRVAGRRSSGVRRKSKVRKAYVSLARMRG